MTRRSIKPHRFSAPARRANSDLWAFAPHYFFLLLHSHSFFKKFALGIVLMEWRWGRTSPSFAVGCVHLEFNELWKPVGEFKAVLWREDQQLQKPPGGLSIKCEDCGQLYTLCLPGWKCSTHLWPVNKPILLHCLTELACVSNSCWKVIQCGFGIYQFINLASCQKSLFSLDCASIDLKIKFCGSWQRYPGDGL